MKSKNVSHRCRFSHKEPLSEPNLFVTHLPKSGNTHLKVAQMFLGLLRSSTVDFLHYFTAILLFDIIPYMKRNPYLDEIISYLD